MKHRTRASNDVVETHPQKPNVLVQELSPRARVMILAGGMLVVLLLTMGALWRVAGLGVKLHRPTSNTPTASRWIPPR